MVQIIPRARMATDRLSEGLMKGAQYGATAIPKLYQQKAVGGLLRKNYPESASHETLAGAYEQGLGEDEIKNLSSSLLGLEKSRIEEKDQQGLSDQDYENIINEMEQELESGGAGLEATIKSYLPWGGEQRESTARFQSQGTALLGLAQKIALKQGIRNQREFDQFMKRTVPNASDTVETAKGKLDALRSYIRGGGAGRSQAFVKMRNPKTGKIFRVPNDQAEAASKAGGILVP